MKEVDSIILKYINYIRTGRYIEKLKSKNNYYGSSNQKLYKKIEENIFINI